MKIRSLLLLPIIAVLFSYDMPKGWNKAGSEPEKYDMGIDPGAGRGGKDAATIKSISNDIKGFGTMSQSFAADKYLGKRVRLSAYIKSKDVEAMSGLWMNIGNTESKKPLAFDNMASRPIKGTTNWNKYEVVLDVPENATYIAYGVLLHGTGQVWFDGLQFETVKKKIPITDLYKPPTGPANLDLKK